MVARRKGRGVANARRVAACRSVKHITGDRNDYDAMKASISGQAFDVVYDINGREAEQVAPILEAIPDLAQYIFCSSAGVYLKSPQMPHRCALLFLSSSCSRHALPRLSRVARAVRFAGRGRRLRSVLHP